MKVLSNIGVYTNNRIRSISSEGRNTCVSLNAHNYSPECLIDFFVPYVYSAGTLQWTALAKMTCVFNYFPLMHVQPLHGNII